jgi:hypothetical protein
MHYWWCRAVACCVAQTVLQNGIQTKIIFMMSSASVDVQAATKTAKRHAASILRQQSALMEITSQVMTTR